MPCYLFIPIPVNRSSKPNKHKIRRKITSKQKNQCIFILCIWVPAHVGVEGNEKADKHAKNSLNLIQMGIDKKISKAESKIIIRKALINAWQELWEETGRHLY